MADNVDHSSNGGESSPNIAQNSDSDAEFSGFEDQEAIRRGAVLVTAPMSDYAPNNDPVYPIDEENGWGKEDTLPIVAPFSKTSKLNSDMDSSDPIDFFKLFFRDSMFQLIKDQTNLYAQQRMVL